jgi:hypothetical protein
MMSPNAAHGPGTSTSNDSVPVTAIAMKLLDIRLKPSTAILESVMGEFTGGMNHSTTNANASSQQQQYQEMVILRAGGTIELWRVEDGQMKLIRRLETRSVLRSMAVLRLTGEKRDVLAVGADGGAISILDFLDGRAQIIHCLTFGKSGTSHISLANLLMSPSHCSSLMSSSIS